MNYNYYAEFKDIISSSKKTRKLLEGSSFSGTFAAWEKRKAFIASAINKNGSFLDIGCGNGFLLRCLQEWSQHNIIPFGIDVNEAMIDDAKELFPDNTDNFAVLDIARIDNLNKCLPTHKFDFVFTSNAWSNSQVGQDDKKMLDKLITLINPGGRLIVGFYHEDKEHNLESIKNFETIGLKFHQIIENPISANLIAIIETNS